jgi:hypothetical protein
MKHTWDDTWSTAVGTRLFYFRANSPKQETRIIFHSRYDLKSRDISVQRLSIEMCLFSSTATETLQATSPRGIGHGAVSLEAEVQNVWNFTSISLSAFVILYLDKEITLRLRLVT